MKTTLAEASLRIPRISFFHTILLTATFLYVLNSPLHAQLDPTFGTGGITQIEVLNNDSAISTFVLPNNQIHIVSKSSLGGTPDKYFFLRFNSDGNPDTNYGTSGIKLLTVESVLNGVNVGSAIRQPDGKFLLFGQDASSGFVARYDANGNIDTSFSGDGYHRPNVDFNSSELVKDGFVYPDGRILTIGTTGSGKIFFVRYLSNGDLDKSFNTDGFIVLPQTGYSVRNMFRQSTGKFVVFSTGSNGILISRFNDDGSIDGTFTNVNYTTSPTVSRRAVLLPDDTIVTAETFRNNNVSLERNNDDIRVRKYTANGSVDNGFGTAGAATVDITSNFYDDLFALEARADGQLLVGSIAWVEGNRTQVLGPQMSLARFSSSGVVNGKFLITNSRSTGMGSIVVQPADGKILAIHERNRGADFDILLTRVTDVPNESYHFKGVPFDFGKRLGYPTTNGIADPTVYRSSNQLWFVYPLVPQFNQFIFGLSTDVFVPSDYINDLGTEMAVFRPSNATWYIARDAFLAHQNFLAVQWGANGDIPVPADYDGDTKTDLAVFRPSNGVWYVRNSADNSVAITPWGTNGDQPVVGDYDGDGKADVSVWRPSDGIWYVLRSSDGQPSFTNFGLNGDIPVQEDYDGDGITDLAVWRPSDQIWYILRSSGGFFAVKWGLSEDHVVPADYDGDKNTDIAVWRPSQGRWYVLRSSDLGLTIYHWGLATDKAVQRRMLY